MEYHNIGITLIVFGTTMIVAGMMLKINNLEEKVCILENHVVRIIIATLK